MLPERFWSKVSVTPDGCWVWTAALNRWGYGRFWDGTRTARAHRVAYEALVGPIPPGMQLDHAVCNRPACVRPEHMSVTTPLENTLRSGAASAANASKTRCAEGHPLPPYRPGGHRRCATCKSQYDRQRHAERGR